MLSIPKRMIVGLLIIAVFNSVQPKNESIGALECFIRELNGAFPHAHPSMVDFVTTIRRISQEKYAQYDRVAKGRERAPVH